MKATRATLKSFVKRNAGKLLVSVRSSFDGMTDCCETSRDKGFYPAEPSGIKGAFENTLDIAGVWLVGGGRDRIQKYEADGLIVMDCYNCCGHFQVAIKN